MLRTICAALALLATTFACSAEEVPAFVEGTHYTVLDPAQPTSSSPEVVEVVEFFWYGCPHCYAFEPHVRGWEQGLPANVEFIRVPGTFNAAYKMHAKAYYTAQVLGILDEVHADFFDAVQNNIHAAQGGGGDPMTVMFATEDQIASFFVQHGVSDAQFRSTFNSFQVSTLVARAESLQRRYRIAHVPTIVVNGKYVTDGTMARTWPRLIEIINHLVDMEQQQR